MRILLPLLAAAALWPASPAMACSPAPGYHVPTNLELAEQADLILVATISPVAARADSPFDPRVAVHPVAVLKG